MAKSDIATDAPASDAPVKRTRKSGPRVAKPTYVLFRVTDADGNAVVGAQLEVVKATKSAEDVMAVLDSNRDVIRTKITL